MQQIQGKVTADAKFKTFENGKTVVNFSLAENQGYKPKDGGEYVNVPTFFNVSYWVKSEKVTKVLRKGATVRIDGRVSARPYQTNTGDWSASLDLLAHQIHIEDYAPKAKETEPAAQQDPQQGNGNGKSKGKNKGNAAKAETETADDLPF